MKNAISIFYIALAFFSAVSMIASLIGNWELGFSWRPEDVAFTFIFMTTFATSVLILQLNRPISWWLLIQTALVGIPLLIASIYHMFPEISAFFAFFHLLLATIFIGMNLFMYLRIRHT